MFLELSEEERRTLEGLLEASLRELREEVYHAEDPGFKDELKREEELLRQILRKLRSSREEGSSK